VVTHIETLREQFSSFWFCSSPLWDPVGFGTGRKKLNFRKYENLCMSEDKTDRLLRKTAQNRQQEWFALWVGQMARIAKPGAPVIIESIARAYCEILDDLGGVEKNWWKGAIIKYNWGVDPESLEYGEDLNIEGRYHVFMRKKTND
jgi:hypothetical protein